MNITGTRVIRRITSLVAIAVAMLAIPSTASAVERYATPNPDLPADCSSGDPCSLQTAVESAANGDEVIVGEGTYNEGTNQLHPTVSTISIHGAAGEQRPVINFGAMGTTGGLWLSQSGPQNLRRLAIEYGGTGPALIVVNSSGTAEQLLVKTSTGTGCEFATSAYTLRDSVCSSSGDNRTGITSVNFTADMAWTLTLRNVTAVGSGASGKGITVSTDNSATTTIDGKNVIAQGGTGASAKDIQVYNFESPTSVAAVNLSHSNYDSACELVSITPVTCGEGGSGASITDPGSGTNQTAAPVFTDGDFHQDASSPTVNAGVADPANGTADYDGDQRSLGAAVDIGADEFPSPPDSDADGVPDASDTCPSEAGPAANGGCPVPAPPSNPGDGGGSGGGGGGGEPADPPADETPRDMRAPETTVRTKVKGDDVTLRFASDEPGSRFECRIDRKALRACTSPKRYRNLDDGRHKVLVVAIDVAGNRDATAAKSKFEIGG